MGKLNAANLKKAFYYLKRNGVKNTWYASLERMQDGQNAYVFIPVDNKILDEQKKAAEKYSVSFSIVVPLYRTKEEYLREMIESVLAQSYPRWELILADATEDDSVEKKAACYTDERIRYIKLPGNFGIAENTNCALQYVRNEYTGLLDHDDVLTPNALFEMAACIEEGKNAGRKLRMLYSDEDKCNGDRTKYYEPNLKEKFNLDLILSNNYICHFLVMDSELIKELGFRKEYDGAQDFDLVLRAVQELKADEQQITHIPKVLYHWRCHEASTAQNPQSKQYAYEAGKRAVQSFVEESGWKAKAVHLKHLGFYGLEYETSIFAQRPEVGAVCGKLIHKRKITGGAYTEEGKILFEGLPASFSGYLHRAVLRQQVYAPDLRLVQVRKECRALFEETVGVPYQVIPGTDIFDSAVLPKGADVGKLSLAFGEALHKEGFCVLWEPSWRKVKS